MRAPKETKPLVVSSAMSGSERVSTLRDETGFARLAITFFGAVHFRLPRVGGGVQVTRSVSEGGRSTVGSISDGRLRRIREIRPTREYASSSR